MFLSLRKIANKIIKLIILLFLMSILLGLVISFVFPIGYKNHIKKYSNNYGIDPFLVSAIINVESKYNKDAISQKNARGLMQIGPQTGVWGAQELGIENYYDELLFEPEVNIMIGTWYLNQLNKEFNNDLHLILAAYNAGSGNVQKWLKNSEYSSDGRVLTNIPFEETKDYLEKVDFNYKVYRKIYHYYMEKPDSINSMYIDVIIALRTNLKKIIQSLM